MMKMVECYDCKKSLKFIDAKPLWNRLDKGPDFLCEDCFKNCDIIENEMELAQLLAKRFILDRQPDSSKREDYYQEKAKEFKKLTQECVDFDCGVSCFAEWLDSGCKELPDYLDDGCGTRNTTETP